MAKRRNKGKCLKRRTRNGVSRCVKRAKSAAKRSGAARGRKRSYRRKPAGMAKRGSKCTRFKRVRVRGSSKMQRRCVRYGR